MPFTSDQFFGVFLQYNEAVWPAQWALVALAVVVIVTAVRREQRGTAGMTLAVLWLWTAVMYHLLFFREINPVATGFAALFFIEAALLAWHTARGRLRFAPRFDAHGVAGAALVLYALVFYPLVGFAAGHRFPASPTFGLPCPTTIFTLGVLLWAERIPKALLAVPVAWSLIGTAAAVRFGMLEDFGLPAAAIIVVLLGGRWEPRPLARHA